MRIRWQWWQHLDSADRVMFIRIAFWVYFVLAPLEAVTLGFHGGNGPLFLLVINPVLTAVFTRVVMTIINAFAHSAVHGLAGSGGDPYRATYSEEEAMVVRGEWQAAVTAYREHLVVNPDNLDVRLRVARLLVRNSESPDEAEILYLDARRVDADGIHDLAISNALIEYYRTTRQDDKLRQEFVRLSRRHAGTPQGDGARNALRRMTIATGE